MGEVQWTPVDCMGLCLLAWCYYTTFFLCVTPAFVLAFPVSPHFSAALHLSMSCLLCTSLRPRDVVTHWLVQLRWFTGGTHPCFGATVPAKGAGWTEVPASVIQHQAEPASPSTPSGVALPSEQGKQMVPQQQAAGILMGFTLFKPLQTYSKHIHSPPNFLCGQQRTGVLLGHGYSYHQLSSWVCWVLTCHKEGAGNSFRCGCHCCKSMWCGCYFLSHQVQNLSLWMWPYSDNTTEIVFCACT